LKTQASLAGFASARIVPFAGFPDVFDASKKVTCARDVPRFDGSILDRHASESRTRQKQGFVRTMFGRTLSLPSDIGLRSGLSD
jgi:hypothetical protein